MKHKIIQKLDLFLFIAILILNLTLAFSAQAQTDGIQTQDTVASGGTFTLEKTAIAGGGNQMQNATLNQSGTNGQSIAGYQSNGGQFQLYSGFWTPENLAPTSANAVVGGRIKNSNGKGIRNVMVTISFPSGETRTTLSGNLGYYSFADIPAGNFYIIWVSAKNYTFNPSAQTKNIIEDTQDIDFYAEKTHPVKGVISQ